MELKSVKKENTEQKIELQTLSSKLNDLETHLAKLQLFDKKLRIIANIEKPVPEGDEHTGMGGASPDEDYFYSGEESRDELVGRLHSDL
ncbi:hypothetical protein GWM83_03095, partial [Candidatus Bathyarchaeota archaeon]|nr:hypothetical protein [Candidatus Bathyarchaeota archaeon]NIW34530.1 hypothetical protein [Candidatus Bathyarchaeota archaeon]